MLASSRMMGIAQYFTPEYGNYLNIVNRPNPLNPPRVHYPLHALLNAAAAAGISSACRPEYPATTVSGRQWAASCM